MKYKQRNSRIQYSSPSIPENQKRFKRNFDNHSKSSSNCSQSSSVSKFYVKNINSNIPKSSIPQLLEGKKLKVLKEQNNYKSKKVYTPYSLYGLGSSEQEKLKHTKDKNCQKTELNVTKLQNSNPLDQIYVLKNRILQFNLQSESSKGKIKMLQLLLEKEQKKSKKLESQLQHTKNQLKQVKNTQKRMKQQIHKLKNLLKQKDNLMSHLHSNKQNNQTLLKTILQQQKKLENYKKRIEQLQSQSFNNNSNKYMDSISSLNEKQNQFNLNLNQSQTDWKKYLLQKEQELYKCKQKNKNLEVEINCLNSKWSKQINLMKKNKETQYAQFKVKYKNLLSQYKDAVKQNFSKMKENYQEKQKQIRTLKKRNLTLDNMKLRPFMSQVKQNKSFQSEKQIQLLEYSSCQD